MTLPTTFNPAEIEARWYEHWETNGCFRPERPDAQAFTIVNPPPNVTGSLHTGHALDNTLQDIVIRYERLRGKDALWVVGTDHAGIATQMVVERQLEARQDKRTNYTREEFVQKVWEWKEESGGTITRQLRRLGCSMDWSREQFTMDDHFTKAVTKVFVDLYNDGLIYRDKRLVNWDPKLRTAISDLEVEQQTIPGHFWHFRYPLADGVTLADGRDYIEVATTRPETMLADMAVAVHPDDERYKSVVGRHVILPITGRRVPIVADEHADPELGSGAVKITPGHDFNDFEVGKRAGFDTAEMLNMFDGDANVVQTADGLIPDEFLGLHRFRRDGVDGARELVVERMKQLGCLIPHKAKTKKGEEVEMDAEPRAIATPFGDRGGVVIEPWLTDQWYLDQKALAQKPIEQVRSGEVEIVPASWEKTFFNWMENILPWCISRQLWWGHRIPAWFSLDGEVFVAETYEEAQAMAGEGVALQQDEDVLDTWFSSALWPFATLGWPEESALLDKHFPNSLLVSGFDILFFWDARMMMMGNYNMGKAPWPRLYLHGLVRAPDGQKMSKSKGNVVDPLGLIDKYGADALRFFMAAMESQGRDIKMDEKRVEGYRNFATKLWNAARFCQSNGIGASGSLKAPAARLAANQWIIGEVAETARAIEKAMEELRFDAAANAIYQFTWSKFCDWYLELIKPVFAEGSDPDSLPAVETRAVAGWALDQILVMLHPFMPFITEELWHAQARVEGGERPYELILAKWPEPQAEVSKAATDAIDWVIDLTTNVRSAKNELGIAPGAKLAAFVPSPSELAASTIERSSAAIERLARLAPVTVGEAPEGPAMQVTALSDVFVIPLEGIIDIETEKARLEKALEASRKEAKSLEGRLSNPNFVERAKPEAVEKAREDHAHHTGEIERLEAALARLG
ncbi:valine--tRNA ligase [Erythrobacter sp.]|uniref:valine--tRNA ligase n=1 Tax=Erythrobacter sp. TaxID=1042 RepID=UPI001425E9EB|nr:valine--tRNA ligase [Erythrobacter sp.]QIQ86904.1 MAG: valine--tRNA ligase [Erythrobacter sp.]